MDIAQVQSRAREVALEHNPSGLVPFPFQEMAKSLGDVDITTIPLSTNQGVSGAIFVQPDNRFTILINQNKPENRRYFTIAHEFAHYFLHADWLRSNPIQGAVDHSELLDGQGMLLRPDIPEEATVDFQKEREANNFAAELLMPEDKVREFWELTKDIEECARAFQVSSSAMAIRLERLHLAS